MLKYGKKLFHIKLNMQFNSIDSTWNHNIVNMYCKYSHSSGKYLHLMKWHEWAWSENTIYTSHRINYIEYLIRSFQSKICTTECVHSDAYRTYHSRFMHPKVSNFSLNYLHKVQTLPHKHTQLMHFKCLLLSYFVNNVQGWQGNRCVMHLLRRQDHTA